MGHLHHQHVIAGSGEAVGERDRLRFAALDLLDGRFLDFVQIIRLVRRGGAGLADEQTHTDIGKRVAVIGQRGDDGRQSAGDRHRVVESEVRHGQVADALPADIDEDRLRRAP